MSSISVTIVSIVTIAVVSSRRCRCRRRSRSRRRLLVCVCVRLCAFVCVCVSVCLNTCWSSYQDKNRQSPQDFTVLRNTSAKAARRHVNLLAREIHQVGSIVLKERMGGIVMGGLSSRSDIKYLFCRKAGVGVRCLFAK